MSSFHSLTRNCALLFKGKRTAVWLHIIYTRLWNIPLVMVFLVRLQHLGLQLFGMINNQIIRL